MEHSEKCLAGENIEFVHKYLSGNISIEKPVDAHIIFDGDKVK